MNLLILLVMVSKVPLVFFRKGGLGIKLPKKCDMPLNNKKTKQTDPDCKMVIARRVFVNVQNLDEVISSISSPAIK